ncbi:hypothetical protein U1T90_003573, partial [Salmonella enterica subsp. enterica serovar Cerro]|nr:hypothetical protein [Salmonella enterica subsp. enterica serovar Cerro]
MKKNETMSFPIESFIMRGVHGYKTLSMKMKGKSTIFVSENGSGKTTVLNALNNLLKGEFFKLKSLTFDDIEIKLCGHEKSFKFDKSEIKETPQEFQSLIESSLGIVDDDFWDENNLDEIISAIRGYTIHTPISDDRFLFRIYNASMYQMAEFTDLLRNFKGTLESLFYKQLGVLGELANALVGYEVVYLPTYRRVEKSFDKEIKVDPRRRSINRRDRMRYLNHDKISYGLRDVEETLSAITIDIERQSSVGYRALSATMLEDLIRYKHRINETISYTIPEIEDLERFLSRVDRPDSFSGTVRSKIERSTPLIQSLRGLYENDSIKDNEYLNYFLSKLNPVIQNTKEQESKIETFVAICNKYLKSAGDSKFLTFDSSKLEVVVYDDFSGDRIQLNDLSSGEKQV